MDANVGHSLGGRRSKLVMRLQTSTHPVLKVVRLPDIKNVPAAIGDWSCKDVEEVPLSPRAVARV